MRFGSEAVLEGLSGEPRLRVRGARMTLCARVILPLAMVSGSKSLLVASEGWGLGAAMVGLGAVGWSMGSEKGVWDGEVDSPSPRGPGGWEWS